MTKKKKSPEQMLVNYLLGNIEEAERQQIEARSFRDHQFREEILAIEQDLILDYLRGELRPEERVQFERSFLRSERRQLIFKQSQRLFEWANRFTPSHSPAIARAARAGRSHMTMLLEGFFGAGWIPAIAAAAAMLSVFAGWMLLVRYRPAQPVEQIVINSPAAPFTSKPVSPDSIVPVPNLGRQFKPASNVARRTSSTNTRRSDSRKVFTFALNVITVRADGGVAEIQIPSNAEFLQLRLNRIEHRDPSYRIVLKQLDGQEVWRGVGLTARAQQLNALVPVKLIRNGDFVLDIHGVNAANGIAHLSQSFLNITQR